MTVRFELGVRRIDQHGGHQSSYSMESDTATKSKQKDSDLCGGIGSTPHFTFYSLITYYTLVYKIYNRTRRHEGGSTEWQT